MHTHTHTHIQTYKYTRKRARGGSAHAFAHGQRLSDTLVKNPLDHILIRSYRRISPCVYLHARPHLHPPPFPSGGSARARAHVDAHTRTYARKIFVKIRRCGYTESAVVDNPHEISSLPDARLAIPVSTSCTPPLPPPPPPPLFPPSHTILSLSW